MPLLLPFLGAPAMSETGSLVFHFTVLVLSLKYFLQPDLNDVLPVPTSALRPPEVPQALQLLYNIF